MSLLVAVIVFHSSPWFYRQGKEQLARREACQPPVFDAFAVGAWRKNDTVVREGDLVGRRSKRHHWCVAVRVLIVDDHATARRAARRTIAFTDGFVAVGEASTGEEAVHAVAELCPDLVLMDLRLPGIDGFEAARLIAGERRRTVVLVVSAYAPEDLDEFDLRLQRSGSAGYVPKAELSPDRLIEEWAAASSDR